MNILAHVHLRNLSGSTGHGRAARQIAEHLAMNSEDQIRILADPRDHQKALSQVGAPWTDFSYHFFKDETSRQQARWIFTGRPRAEDYWPQTEVVYCTGDSYVPTKKARLAVTLHDAAMFEEGALPNNWRFFKQRQKSRYLYRLLSRKADMVHTCSQSSLERLAHFFPGMRNRLRVIYHAVTPRMFEPVSDEGESYLREQGLKKRQFILLPGGLNHRKNARVVLGAWPIIHEKHPELRLVVAGNCEAVFIPLASALGESVMLTGFVSDEVLCSLYHSAEVVWFPSLYEGFGLPVVEAMACGTPVVASNQTSMPEVGGDAAILVSSKSVTEHAEAIGWLLDDSRQRETLKARGLLRAQQFTWQRSAAELRRQFSLLV